VEAALDERRDPLQCPQLVRELAADPRARAEVERLMERLAALPESEPASALRGARFSVTGASLAAAFVVAAGIGLWISRSRAGPLVAHGAELDPSSSVSLVVERTSPAPARCARVVLEPRRVVAWTLEGERP
jgi:hypothetical protein